MYYGSWLWKHSGSRRSQRAQQKQTTFFEERRCGNVESSSMIWFFHWRFPESMDSKTKKSKIIVNQSNNQTINRLVKIYNMPPRFNTAKMSLRSGTERSGTEHCTNVNSAPSKSFFANLKNHIFFLQSPVLGTRNRFRNPFLRAL